MPSTLKNISEVVFVTYGSYGDIYPLLSIALVLNEHLSVTFVSNEYYRHLIERNGIKFVAAGTMEEQYSTLEESGSSGANIERLMNNFRNMVGKNISRVTHVIEAIYKKNPNTAVVVHGCNLSPAYPVCEKHGIPVFVTYYAPSHIPINREEMVFNRIFNGKSEFYSRYVSSVIESIKLNLLGKPFARDIYNYYRNQSGFPPDPSPIRRLLNSLSIQYQPVHRLRIAKNIVLAPKWFCEPIGRDVSHMEFVGFPFHKDENMEANSVVNEFVNRHGKPIIITPGTGVKDVENYIALMPEVCKLTKTPIVFLSRHGEFQVGSPGRDLPILQLRHVDLADILPSSKAIVHHGGIGTIAQAIRAGIPQLIIPSMYDQPANAARVVSLALGGILYPDCLNSENLVDILSTIENSEVHRKSLEYYSNILRTEDGAVNAANTIIRCLSGKRFPKGNIKLSSGNNNDNRIYENS